MNREDQKQDTSDAGHVKRRAVVKFGTLATTATGAAALSGLVAGRVHAAAPTENPTTSFVPMSEKGAVLGVATLDSDSKVPLNQLPDLSAIYGPIITPTGDTAGPGDTAALQAAINRAAETKTRLTVRGEFTINGQINVPSNSDIDFAFSKITQIASLKPVLALDNVSGVTLRGLRAQGKTSDYVNNSSVYAAAAIHVTGTSTKVSIVDGFFLGFAGAGIYLGPAVSDVRIMGCRMTGPGSAYILSSGYNYSAGIVTLGSTKWMAKDNEISDFAHGIVTGGNMWDIRVLDNYIHDIPGQHGIYLGSVNGGIVSGNVVRNTKLAGLKIQIAMTTSSDTDSVSISGNIFMDVGAQGILLTNVAGGAPRTRRTSVTGNVVRNSFDSAFAANNSASLLVAENIFTDCDRGIDIATSRGVTICDNRIARTKQTGIRIDSIDVVVEGNRIEDPAISNNTSSEFGLQVYGTSSDVTLRDNKITDSLGNMRYGIYVSAGDLTTMDFIGNRVTGATDYGYRGLAMKARTFSGNSFVGTAGRLLIPPSNFRPIASPKSDTVGTKAAIDAIRAALEANGLTP